MNIPLLEAGKIVGTHGLGGELKIEPWSDTPEFLCGFDAFYLDEAPRAVQACRVQGGLVFARLEGVGDREAARALVGKVIWIAKEQAVLPGGRHFVADLLGLEVRDALDGDRVIGTLCEILPYPAQNIYRVRGDLEYLIPAVDAFLVETNRLAGYIRVRLLEGMAQDPPKPKRKGGKQDAD